METGSAGVGMSMVCYAAKFKNGKLFCVEYSKGLRTGFHVRRATGSMEEVAARLNAKLDAPPKKGKAATFGTKRYRSRRKRSVKQQELIPTPSSR